MMTYVRKEHLCLCDNGTLRPVKLAFDFWKFVCRACGAEVKQIDEVRRGKQQHQEREDRIPVAT
jgi:hypothetical protein